MKKHEWPTYPRTVGEHEQETTESRLNSEAHHGLRLAHALSELGYQFGFADSLNSLIERSGISAQLDQPADLQNPDLRRQMGMLALIEEIEQLLPKKPERKFFKKAEPGVFKGGSNRLKITPEMLESMISKPSENEEQWQKIVGMYKAIIAVLPSAISQWQAKEEVPQDLEVSLDEVKALLSAETDGESLLEKKILIDIIEGLSALANINKYYKRTLRYLLLERLIPPYGLDSLSRYSVKEMEELQLYGLLDVPCYVSALQDATCLPSDPTKSYSREKISGYTAAPSQDAVSAISYEKRLSDWKTSVYDYQITKKFAQSVLSLLREHTKKEKGLTLLDKEWAVDQKSGLLLAFDNILSSPATVNAWNFWKEQGAQYRTMPDFLFSRLRYLRIRDFSEVRKATLECFEFIRANDTEESNELLFSLLSLWDEKLRQLYELTVE